MAESVIRDEDLDEQESLEDVVADVIQDEEDANPTPETGQSQEDWEARFKGLQGRLQQEIEARRYTEAEKVQLEARLLQASVRDMDPEDQQAAMALWQQQQQHRYSQMQTAQTQAQMNELAKVFVVNQLSQKYGVPVKELEQFPDPHSMEAHARLVADNRRSQKKAERKTDRKDNFGSGGSGVASPKRKKPANLRDARSAFAEAAKRMQRER